MMYTTLQRKTSWYDLGRNWAVSYIFNLAGCLFFAGVLSWWSNALESNTQSTYAVTQAEGRVNINWGYNFTKGIGCNWLVGLAVFMSTSCRDGFSKIAGIWIPIWAFVCLGYQHSIANFFLVPIGMFYGTNFGVGKFIYQSVIPVTLGNIVGGALMVGVALWFLYGIDGSTSGQVSGNREIKGSQSEHEGSPNGYMARTRHRLVDDNSLSADHYGGVSGGRGLDLV
ncbi:hypothetical protein CKAH01_09784 [Colletotrichum kahawae]|uniref:Formate/nitrite transporter n=1 Tax=Colletotrichum kahawae TaxID=34407 RepID=A0AAD9XXL1_COLKA|nr:hypothetical protein CKAH01_09784 [Colletotrichum kahawae]